MNLINKAKNGDLEALSELIKQHELILYKTAKTVLKNPEDVKDAVQETLINIYTNLKDLKHEKYFKTWAIRILINKCYDIINKNNINSKKNDKVKEVYIIEVNDVMENKLEETDLEKALKSIDEKLRLITIMYYYNNFKIREIAKILNIPEGTVKFDLSKARKDIYKILNQEEVNS